jgi:PAS domain S-box-containing protein
MTEQSLDLVEIPSNPSVSSSPQINVADAIKLSELRYRRLFETARDGILILDSDEGHITDANPFMSELLGYSHDELLGKELWEIGLLKDKEASQEAFRQLKIDGYIRYEDLPLWSRTREKREVEFVSNLYVEGGQTVIQCNVRDVTARKQVVDQLAAAASKNERIAEVLQRSMLQNSTAGKFARIAVETLYQAALNEAAVGGDFFDAFAMSGDKVAFVVGDVSGKGLIAAGRTAEVKYALRAFLHEYQEPGVAMTRLNDFICDTHRLDADNGEMFIILVIAVVNSVTGDVVFSSAGAEPTLILRSNNQVDHVVIAGTPLGIERRSVYASFSTVLEIGDTVMMVTDGITEARHERCFLGLDGFAELAVKNGSGTSLGVLCRSIYDGAQEFAHGNITDDVCLLLARRQ